MCRICFRELANQGKLPGVNADHLYNLGGFMFAFTVFWSYIGFAQYMLMWYANMPEEVVWYKARLAGGWHGVTIALIRKLRILLWNAAGLVVLARARR